VTVEYELELHPWISGLLGKKLEKRRKTGKKLELGRQHQYRRAFSAELRDVHATRSHIQREIRSILVKKRVDFPVLRLHSLTPAGHASELCRFVIAVWYHSCERHLGKCFTVSCGSVPWHRKLSAAV